MRARSIAVVSGLLGFATGGCSGDKPGEADTAAATTADIAVETATPVETSGPDETGAVTIPAETSPETTFSETVDT